MKLVGGDWIIALDRSDRDEITEALEIAMAFYDAKKPERYETFADGQWVGDDVTKAFADIAKLYRLLSNYERT